MIVVTGSAKLSEEGWDIAIPAMKAMMKATREEAGCISYNYSRDLEDPLIFRAIEKFKDEAALKDHFTAPHMAAFRKALAEAKPQDLAIEVYGATKVEIAL